MPRDLFGDVTRPSISIGNRKWYTVPVSLLSHSIVITMFVVLPILAAPYMPAVLDGGRIDYTEIIVPPPPSAPRPPRSESKPVADPNAFPVETPDGFKPEPPVEVSPVETTCCVVGGIDDLDRELVPPPVIVKPAAQPDPVRIGGTIRNPIKLRGNDPVYPAIAQAARVQGIVILEATLGPDGRMVNARILRSVPLLDQAALEAVRTWEYTPTMLNGVPVPVIMTITVQFTLSK
jgi:periplasmic protein TonB